MPPLFRQDVLVTSLKFSKGRGDNFSILFLPRTAGVEQFIDVGGAKKLTAAGAVDLEDADGVTGGYDGEVGAF